MSKITSDWKLHSSNTPIGHLLAEVPNGIHNKMNQSQTKPNIDNPFHQNIALSSKMKKIKDRPDKDPELDGSIMTIKE